MAEGKATRLQPKFWEWVDKKGKRGEIMSDILERLCKYPGRKK